MSDTKTQEKKRPPTSRMPLVPIVIIVLMLAVALFGEKGVLRMLQARRQRADLEQQVARQEDTNRRLQAEAQRLQSDRRYIENIARQELGMVKEDEIVYQFPDDSAESGPVPAPPKP
jgi:cell division protein FtsL